MTDKAGQNPMRRGDQPLRSTAPTDEPDQRFMVVDPSSGVVQDVDRDAVSDGHFKWTTGDKDAPFDTGPKPTMDDLVGMKEAPFDVGLEPTEEDLAGHKDASFDTDVEVLGEWTSGEVFLKIDDIKQSPLDDSAAWKVDANVETPKEEIDEFAGRFEVVEFVEVPFDDALRLDEHAGGLWATPDPLLEPLDGADAFDAGADGALDF